MSRDNLGFLELSSEILNRGNRLRFQARGKSMHPVIRDGDILEIDPIETQDIRPGDVIFYRTKDGHMFVHRMIKKIYRENKPAFLAKGDLSLDYGEIVFTEDILGRVLTFERNGRKVIFDRGLNKLTNFFYATASNFKKLVHSLLQNIFNNK